MKPTIAVIGSAVADIILQVPSLPKQGEDLHIQSQTMSLGGCAYNVAHILHHYKIPFLACMPVGTGIYGDFVYQELSKAGIHSIFPRTNHANGCCYCFVEPNGERTFLSYHGAEYQITSQAMSLLHQYPISTIYLCGLELEEATGKHIIEYVKQHPTLTIYFAPGPRFSQIKATYLEVLFHHHCILHLNQQEAFTFTKKETMEDACLNLYNKTGQIVIITSSAQGCYTYDGNQILHVPAKSAIVTDTIGAGDSHIGAILANRALGKDWQTSLNQANSISAAVVSVKGSTLSEDQFHQAIA